MNDVVIMLNGLEKCFLGMDKFVVVSFDCIIYVGYVMGLVGLDGVGKIMLMWMLVGLLKFDSGSVMVIGFDLIKNDGVLYVVFGYMSQKFGLYEDFMVMENFNLYVDLCSVIGEVCK